MAHEIVGNTVAEWDDDEPLIFTLRKAKRPEHAFVVGRLTISLSRLREGFEDDFLLNFKDHLIERLHKVSLRTIDNDSTVLGSLFQKVIDLKLFDSKIEIIDEPFLLCLSSVVESLTTSDVTYLRQLFNYNPYSPLFAKGLQLSDFPATALKKGRHGSQIDRILGKALTHAAVARILDTCDTAYAKGEMDIGHYTSVHLAFAVFCRPESYRQIRLEDFWFDLDQSLYFIAIIRVKSGEQYPGKVIYRVNEHLGVLLKKQRQHVVATYGHLVDKENVGKLALFPARQLMTNGSRWTHAFANESFGTYETSHAWVQGYGKAIKEMLNDDKLTLSANVLRHTIGTLLAQTGASAKTIQAVLKHASDTVCKAYVDIAFNGLIEALSETMRPAFHDHLPTLLNFRSKCDPVPTEKNIRSEDLETGKIEEIGECGRDIACENAPIVCYGCFRFHPCWDADHSINLNIVEREIDELGKRGKPFETMVKRAETAKNRILIIMYAADRYRDAMHKENSHK